MGDRTGKPFPGMAQEGTVDLALARRRFGNSVASTTNPDVNIRYNGSVISISLPVLSALLVSGAAIQLSSL
jgi:hypothetical protein